MRDYFRQSYDNWGIPAAHCFLGKWGGEIASPQLVEAHLGRHNLSDLNEPGSRSHSITEIVIHHEWKQDEEKFDADIAILVLKDAAVFNSFVRSVGLPEPGNNSVTGIGTTVGWGMTENSTNYNEVITPSKLQHSAIDGNTCYPNVPKLAKYASKRMFCGGFVNQSKAACNGDSGGGFYSSGESSTWTVRGIVSGTVITASKACDVNAYTLYTNVAEFRAWIAEVMGRTIERVKAEFHCEVLKR